MTELEQFLEHPDAVLESLVAALTKGQYDPELWAGLHRAAERDHRLAELAFAYEQVTHERRARLLSHEAQIVLLDHASVFLGEAFGDLDTAIGHAEKLLALAPERADNVERLQRWLKTLGKMAKLGRIEVTLAKTAADSTVRRQHLESALVLARDEQADTVMALEVLEQILQLEPDYGEAAELMEERLLALGRWRDAARRMEARLSPLPTPDERQLQLRERLLSLYTKELPEPPKAMAQVEAILPMEPSNGRALLAAETLCSVSLMAPRALAVLSDAHEKMGNLTRAAALLGQELKLARGGRKTEVARRLAVLREEVLGDSAGALELLAAVVTTDPSDDEARERYVRLSLALDRAVEAARQLGRAAQMAKEPLIRVKLSVDLGILQRRTGEMRRARAALEEAVRLGSDERSSLRASRELSEIYSQSGEWRPLANVLEIICRLETVPEARHDAARRLISLWEQELGEPEKCVTAWRALEDAPEADEMLAKLQAYYEGTGDVGELGRVLVLRAQRSHDPEERMRLDVLATQLVVRASANRSEAIAAWQALIGRHGPLAEALDCLIELLETEGRVMELAVAIEQRLQTTDGALQAPLLVRLGRLQANELSNEAQAVRYYGLALRRDPSERTARAELAKRLDVEVLRPAVVAVLEPIVRAEAPSPLLVEVLKAKLADIADVQQQLELTREVLQLAGEKLGRNDEAFALAVSGLGLAIAAAPERAAEFIVAVEQNAQYVDPKTRAMMLEFALGDSTLSTPESRQLAAQLSDALSESGEPGRAIELLRRALENEPTSPELLARMDDLLASQATPAERVALYSEALTRETRKERRRDIFARMAALTQQEFREPKKAIELWKEVLALDESHLGAHQALVALYTELKDDESVKLELGRSLLIAGGERRLKILDAMVDVLLRSGESEQALSFALQALEASGSEDDSRAARAEQLARELGQYDVVERLLEGRVRRSGDSEAKMKLLASLGKVRATLQKSASASEAFTQAADLAEEHKSIVRAADLLESALTANGTEESIVTRLWDVCVKNGDLKRLERPLRAMLKLGFDEKDVIRRLVEVAGRPWGNGAASALAELVDLVLSEVTDVGRRRQLFLLRARCLSMDTETLGEAAAVYRGLMEASSGVDEEIWSAYAQLFERAPNTPETLADLRWFYERRVALSPDPVREYLNWARLEQSRYGDNEAATALYEKVLKLDHERLDVWTELARLRRDTGDLAGLAEALDHVAGLSDAHSRFEAQIERAALLSGALGRTADALCVVESLLVSHPADGRLLTIVRQALDDSAARSRAAELLEQVAEAATDPAARAEVLETLLRVTKGVGDFDEARARWTLQLIDTHGDDLDTSLAVALRMADELPAQISLWERVERIARRLNRPEPVIVALESALLAAPEVTLAEEIGRRLVDFHEEWAEDADQVVPLLERVYAACGATWAFDRLKLAFNAAGRWAALFALYDHAIEGMANDGSRAEMLREAAMAAKDFAGDPDRALHYFVQLDELEPGDTRVEAAIERLYERQGLTRPLIELLTRQMGTAQGEALFVLQGRVASLWLDIEEPIPAFGVVVNMLEERPSSEVAVELLERIVTLPSAANSVFPEAPQPLAAAKKDKKDKEKKPSRPLNVRHKVAVMLRKHYEEVSRTEDVVRMLAIEVVHALDDQERVDRLKRLISMRLTDLKDFAGAFEDLTALVALEPQIAEHRQALDELASRTNHRVRQARLLSDVADRQPPSALVFALRLESADVFREHVQDFGRAVELYGAVLRDADYEAPKPPAKDSKREKAYALTAARHLDPLLEQLGRAEERAFVLERLAALETQESARRRALLVAASVSLSSLSDPERAVRLYREQLACDLEDAEARDGLIVALDRCAMTADLIAELENRATRANDGVAARADRARIARVCEDVLGLPDDAISAWRRLRELHGRDAESFDALVALLTSLERWQDLAVLLRTDADVEGDALRAADLRRRLGNLYREQIGDPIEAVRSFVAAADWELALNVVRECRQERELARRVCREVFDLAVLRWTLEAKDASSPAALAAAWALAELSLRLREVGAYKEVVSLLLEGAELPFHRSEKRALLRDAAYLCSDELKETNEAVTVFERIFAEDSGDEIALSSVSRFARLLEEIARLEDVVALWEGQAEVRSRHGDKPTSAALWVRAAGLSEGWLKDVERAIRDYKHGADLGLDVALEALARIYTAQGEHLLAANFLDRLCGQSSREALGERALTLATAYVAAMRPDKARACLESASLTALHVGPVRRRLAELYQESQSWEQLAALHALEAARASDAKERFRLLDAAARVHVEYRQDHASAVPYLEQAVELELEDASLRLRLAEALMNSGRFADAVNVLRAQLERYGSRRPKERAIVHFALARALLGLSEQANALEELVLASRIDPAHPRILHLQARLSLDVGDLARAERTYRALLLVLGRHDDADGPRRAEALVDLSIIAAKNGDEQRAMESIESAFEAGAESLGESLALERGLRELGRMDLLGRALQERLARTTDAGAAALALAELTALHAETLGNLREVQAELRRKAESVESALEKTSLGDEQAWSALARVYEQLGDAEAESRITERRVRGWLSGNVPIDDPEPLYRLATLRLGAGAVEEEALLLLRRAAETRPDFERVDRLLAPVLEANPDWAAGLELLEKVARQIGRSDLVARALAWRLRSTSATAAEYEEAVALARRASDTESLEPLLAAAATGTLSAQLSPEVRAKAELELAEILEARGEVERATRLRENAAQFVEPMERRKLLLEVAVVVAEQLHDLERACGIYERLHEDEPGDATLFGPLLELLRRLGAVDRQAIVIARALTGVTSGEARVELQLEQAKLSIGQGDNGTAADLLRDLLRDEPTQSEAALLLAEILERSGRYAELVILLNRQLGMAEQNREVEAIRTIGLRTAELYEKQSRFDEALSAVETVLAWHHSDPDALRLVVRLAEALGDLERAAGALEELLGLPDLCDVTQHLERLIWLRERLGDESGVERAMLRAFDANPTDRVLTEQLVARFRSRGDIVTVAQVLDRAVRSCPEDLELALRLAGAYREAGQFEDALAVVEGLCASGIDIAELHRERGRVLSAIGRHDEALAALEAGDPTSPEGAAALLDGIRVATPMVPEEWQLQLGLREVGLLEQLKELEHAREILELLNERFPGNLSVLGARAGLAATMGDLHGAVDAYVGLAEVVEGEELVALVLDLVTACEQLGTPERARAALERAVSVAPLNQQLRTQLQVVYRALGANRELAGLLLDAARLIEDAAERQSRLVEIAELLSGPDGDPEQVEAVLEEARELGPDNLDVVIGLARARASRGRSEAALELLSEAASSQRSRRTRALSRVYYESARIQLDEGFLTDAFESLQRATEIDLRNGALSMSLGRLALEIDEREVAQKTFGRVAMMKLVEPDATDGAAEGVTRQDRAEANFQLALFARELGDQRKARMLLQKALTDNPNHEQARAVQSELG